MKTNYYSILLALISCIWFTLLACSIILNVCQYIQRDGYVNKDFDSPVFVWNDDCESIPMDNTPVLLEFGSKNSDTLYIGLLKQNPAEYQFVVTDDSITVKDFDKEIGTIKLEGQLKELINQHNK